MSKQGKLIMSFHQGGKVTDGKGKKVKATAVQKKAIQATKRKCKPPKPVTVIKHTSSGVPVVSHCRAKRAGRGGAVASEPKRVGETKGALSNATLKALGKAPAKKAPAKKAPAKKAPAKKAPAPAPPAKKVIKVRRPRAKRAGETKGALSKAVLKGIGKEPATKRIKVKGTRALRAGEKKGALSERVAGSLARAREQKQRSSNPSLAYA